VVAVDPSVAMLEAAQRGGVDPVVAGVLPELPFADGSFDLVLAAFVISHTDDPEAAVGDMRRVLRPGGTVGLSAWAAGTDAFVEAWTGVAREFVPEESLSAAIAQVLPGEATFSKAHGLESLLAATGFEAVRESTRTIEFSLKLEEYLESREVGAGGRALRFVLDDPAWERFRARLRAVMHARFAAGVSYSRDVHFAVARRPGG
jgi:SAM-dependent methyltransferase